MESGVVNVMHSGSQKKIVGWSAGAVIGAFVVLIWIRACSDLSAPSVSGTEARARPVEYVRSETPLPDAVEFPGLGNVTGRRVQQRLEVSNPETGYRRELTPETLILDEQGNFLYLRNHLPLHDSKKRLDLVEQFLRENRWRAGRMPGDWNDGSFRILGPGKVSLTDPLVLWTLLRRADDKEQDVEIWAVRINFPGEGELDCLLVGETSGSFDDNRNPASSDDHFVWNRGLTRSWELIQQAEERETGLRLNRELPLRAQIIEEWNVVPPDAYGGPHREKKNGVGFVWEGEVLDYDTYLDLQRKLGKGEAEIKEAMK